MFYEENVMYYLGIDGGGTKTAFVLCDDRGNIISTHRAGSCYFSAIGEKAVFDMLREGFDTCTKGIASENVSAYCGMPQIGELESVDIGVENIKKNIGFEINFGNDVLCASAGSLMFRPGIHLIAGTGSNAVGTDKNGNSVRAGGWGCEIQGDEASAYYIAMEMFHEFTKQSDHRHPRTILYEAIRNKFSLDSDFDICRYLIEDIKMERDIIASYAVMASELYKSGDTAIKRIFENAADELCQIACAINSQLDFGACAEVSYSGGVFKSGEAILAPLEKKLSENGMKLCAPLADPVIGSVLLAARTKGETNLEVMKQNLKK